MHGQAKNLYSFHECSGLHLLPVESALGGRSSKKDVDNVAMEK